MTAPTPNLIFFHLDSLFGRNKGDLPDPTYLGQYVQLFYKLKKRGNKYI